MLKDALGFNIVIGQKYGYVAKNRFETNTTIGEAIEINDYNNKVLIKILDFASKQKYDDVPFRFKPLKNKQWIDSHKLFPVEVDTMGWEEANT